MCLSGCSGAVAEAELLGVYIASYRGDTATLSLKADRTYTHVLQLKDGQALETGATWKATQLNSGLRRTVVEFFSFRVIPSYAETRNAGWATEVERTWLGRVRLCFDDDVGYCYIKQASW